MGFHEEQIDRFYNTVNSLLVYANAAKGTCINFDLPVNSDERIWQGMRIALDLWGDISLIDGFSRTKSPNYQQADYHLASTWRDALRGPFACIETHGDKALFLCEGSVFEVRSITRKWDDMIRHTPDVVMTALLPFEGVIVNDGFMLRHPSDPIGPGVRRIKREFKEGLKKGVIKEAQPFIEESRRIRHLREMEGLDPVSYTVLQDCATYLDFMLWNTCRPYEMRETMRSWY